MKVYIVTEEPYHDNSTLHGAYLTLEAAEASVPGITFAREGYYVHHQGKWGVVSQSTNTNDDGNDFLIHERELKGSL